MSTCTYTVDEHGVALMKINKPPMNALGTAVIADIRQAVEKALADDSVRVVVFTGEGKAFIAGADITEFTDLNTQQAGSDWLKPGQEALNLIAGANKPFIAAINGFALGGGCEVALACHIRLADENAQMGLPEIKLGIIPGFGGTQRAPRQFGTGRAYELILSGNFITGRQAAEYGIVNRCVPKGEVVNEAIKLAKAIALRGRPAVKAAMEVIQKGLLMEFNAALKMERDAFGALCETENKREGIAAFLEKRDPVAKDR
ncbi:MAG: enoyl-CoA hydratase/isomerase family protein [Spirochaetes bacterium]|nr:enoyl-CoA hydratase/isomerase family protein [Spirochaetota bacterium]